jgi:DNA ligase 1
LQYSSIAEAYEKIEATTKRLEMTDYLVDILKKTPTDLIDKVVYLTQGKLYPDFIGIEIGIAEKLAIRAVAKSSGHRDTQIIKKLQTIGDLGETTEKFMEKKTQSTFFSTPLTVQRV